MSATQPPAAAMPRPPLISPDIAPLPSRSRLLLAAGCDLDGLLRPVCTVHVDVIVLELLDAGLRQVGPVRLARRVLLDHGELLGDVGRPLERGLVHDPDAGLVRPRERVDLVQLPALVALTERWAAVEHVLQARIWIVAAEDPALEARLQEPLRDVLVLLVGDPGALDEDAVLEHRRAGVLHRD